MNFILDYHEHGYSKKSSHKSGWVSDFWAKHSRQCIHIKYPRAKTLQEIAKKHTSVGGDTKFISPRKSPLRKKSASLMYHKSKKHSPFVTKTIILISKSPCRVIRYYALPCITRRKNYQIFLICDKTSKPCHYSTFPCISRHKKRTLISPRAVNCAGFRYSVLK